MEVNHYYVIPHIPVMVGFLSCNDLYHPILTRFVLHSAAFGSV